MLLLLLLLLLLMMMMMMMLVMVIAVVCSVSVLAAACIRNLRQTFRYGGRQTLPSKVEVTAATVSRRQLTHTLIHAHSCLVASTEVSKCLSGT